MRRALAVRGHQRLFRIEPASAVVEARRIAHAQSEDA